MNSKTYVTIIIVVVVIFLGAGGYIYYKTHLAPQPVTPAQVAAFTDASNKGDTDTAVTLAQNMVNSDPKDVSSLLNLALAYLNKGSLDMQESVNADKAIAVVNQILALNPNSTDESEAYRALGYAYEIKQQYDQAIPAYDKAIQLNPMNDAALANRGHAYDLMGKGDLALADYKAAFAMNPANEYLTLNLARYYQSAGDASSTIKYAQLTLALTSSARAIVDSQDLIGLANIDQQNFDAANLAFDAAIAADPKYDMSYVDRAFGNLNKFAQATGTITPAEEQIVTADVTTALNLNPNNTSAWQVRFFVDQTDKKDSAVIADAHQILSMVDNDIALGQADKDGLKAQMNEALASYNTK